MSTTHTRVLVDAWHLAGASANRGIGTYLRGVLGCLVGTQDLEIEALATRGARLPDGVGRRSIRRIAPDRFAQREHDVLLPLTLRLAARAKHADVYLSPADNPPARCPVPWVQMLHDLIPLVVRSPEFAADARRWERIGGRLRDAAVVVTNSQNTANDAVDLLGVDADRIRVAPLGVDPAFRPASSGTSARAPTILYVGEYGPHKGFAEAFATIAGLADAGFPHRLAMTGYLAPWHEPSVRSILEAAARPELVDLRGFVDDIVAQYQAADVLVVTSRYEGFCLPALEAMACGTPVVAFANSAIPEVVGPAGILVPDGDVEAMVSAVGSLLENVDERRERSAAGVEHARHFTWARCAAVHADALVSAARSA